MFSNAADKSTSFSGPILLFQEDELTLFHQLEGVVTIQDHLVTTQDHHGILPLREVVIMNEGHILLVMIMVLGKLKMEMGMTSKLKSIHFSNFSSCTLGFSIR